MNKLVKLINLCGKKLLLHKEIIFIIVVKVFKSTTNENRKQLENFTCGPTCPAIFLSAEYFSIT